MISSDTQRPAGNCAPNAAATAVPIPRRLATPALDAAVRSEGFHASFGDLFRAALADGCSAAAAEMLAAEISECLAAEIDYEIELERRVLEAQGG